MQTTNNFIITSNNKNIPKPIAGSDQKELLFLGANDFFAAEGQNLPFIMKTQFKYNVQVFNDSNKALNWLENRVLLSMPLPVGIICDLELLLANQFIFLEELQNNPFLKYIPFIAISDGKVHIDPREALLRGIDDFYAAPFLVSDIYDRLEFLHQFKMLKANLNIAEDVPFESSIPIAKRLFDIIFSTAMLIALSPLFLLVALLIRLESRGPIFYSSKRVGTGYRIFDFYKFRSMRSEADKELQNLIHLNQYNTQPQPTTNNNNEAADNPPNANPLFVKFQNDPRITRVGQFIRKTSIDELPQLFNVLKGDMSIVGNRPLPLYEAEQLTRDLWAMRFLAPAGITGLWQVSKRGQKDMSAEERIALDNAYAKHYSIWFDLKIILKTIPAMLQRENV